MWGHPRFDDGLLVIANLGPGGRAVPAHIGRALPKLNARLQHYVGRKEYEQAPRNDSGEVGQRQPQVLLVVCVVPIGVTAIQSCTLGPGSQNSNPNLHPQTSLTVSLLSSLATA